MYLKIKGLEGPVRDGKNDGSFKVLTMTWPTTRGRLPQRLKKLKMHLMMAFDEQVLLFGLQLAGAEYPEVTLSVEQKDHYSLFTFIDVMFGSLSLASWDGNIPEPEQMQDIDDDYEVDSDETPEDSDDEEEEDEKTFQLKSRVAFEATMVCRNNPSLLILANSPRCLDEGETDSYS